MLGNTRTYAREWLRLNAWLIVALLIILAVLIHVAHAQTIAVTPKTGRGVVDQTVTYTVPSGATCTLSGGTLTGTVTANGSKTLVGVTAPTTTYTITCPSLPGKAVLVWTKPTLNTDGSTLTDLTGYKAYYGTSSAAVSARTSSSVSIAGANTLTTTITGLTPGTYSFAMAAVSTSGGEGLLTNLASSAIVGTAGGTASDTATITPVPQAPGGLTATETYAYSVTLDCKGFRDCVRAARLGNYKLDKLVGSVALGTHCKDDFSIGDYYRVDRKDVTFDQRTRSAVIVAKCRTV